MHLEARPQNVVAREEQRSWDTRKESAQQPGVAALASQKKTSCGHWEQTKLEEIDVTITILETSTRTVVDAVGVRQFRVLGPFFGMERQ